MEKRPSHKLSKIVELIQLYIEDQLSNGKHEISPIPYIMGPPGVGKSYILTNLVKHLQPTFDIKTDHPALRPVEMFSGIPDIIKQEDEFVTKWSKPEFIQFNLNSNYGIWLWDDFHLLDPNQAKYCFEIFTYRKIHDYEIPNTIAIILAGNDSKKAGSRNIFSPIINRVGIFKVKPDVDEWIELYINNTLLDQVIDIIDIDESNIVEPHETVVAFLDRNNEFAIEEENTSEPFATFRSWTFVGRIIERYMQKLAPQKNKEEIELDILTIVSAHTSTKAAYEFMNYFTIFRKFDPKKVIEEGEFYTYSNDGSVKSIEIYVSTFSTTKYFFDKYTKTSDKQLANRYFDNYVKFFNHLVKNYSYSEAGVTGALLKSLTWLRNKFAQTGRIKDIAERFSPSYPVHFDKKFIDERVNIVLSRI